MTITIWLTLTICFASALCILIPVYLNLRELELQERRKNITLAKELADVPLANPNPVMGVDKFGYVLFANYGGEIILSKWNTGLRKKIPEEYREINKQILLSKKPHTIEASLQKKVYLLTIVPVNQNYIHIYGTDITSFKAQEEELLSHKTQDEITKLPNQIVFHNLLQEATQSIELEEKKFAVLVLRIDDYTQLGYTYGQPIKDKLVVELAERIQTFIGDEDTLAKISDHEFGIIKYEVQEVSELATFVEKLIEISTSPYTIHEKSIGISVSIGITLCPNDGQTDDILMRNAQLAINRTSETKSQYEFFQRGMEDQIQIKREIIDDLHMAIRRCEFEVHYQPQIDIKKRYLKGCEALIRWKHPTKGYISPFFFIPASEESNLINPISEWILNESCQQISKWRKQGVRPFQVSVNLSARQILKPDIMQIISETVNRYQITPEWLAFELTESALVDNKDRAIKVMKEIKDLGFKIALDDFGTGYSSLSYLLQFPIDKLKMDRAFVKIIESQDKEYAVTKSIIELGHRMKLEIIAEGVETPMQLQYFYNNDCHIIQGYIFGEPLPAEKFDIYFKNDWNKIITKLIEGGI